MCNIRAVIVKIISNEDFRTILFTILFQMVLPFTDTGTDIRLGIRLFINGHPKWALAVLMPVFINTFFTTIACREMEKRANKKYWVFYLPLVIFQLYPQFCICRLLFQYYQGKINLEQFISARDSMDGGLGCVEPYCESVPQVYIQTTIFALIHNMDQLIIRLCFTEKAQTCFQIEEEDRCGERYDCHSDRFLYGYQRYKDYDSNCFAKFEDCKQDFSACINRCKIKLRSIILNQDESVLYEYASNNTFWQRHDLAQKYDATQDDLKMI